MSGNILHAPLTIGPRARRLMYIAIGLVAVALVVAALISSGGDSKGSAPSLRDIAVGRGAVPAHPDEAATAAAVGRGSAESADVPPGSAVPIGRAPYGPNSAVPEPNSAVPEPNLLPK